MTRRLRNPAVRKRLFADDDVTSQASTDNSSNLLREIIAADRLRMMQKWNFDTENDRQFDQNGPIEWVPTTHGKYSWIGKVKDENKKEPKDAILKMKEQNEETPVATKEDGRNELQRKRKKDGVIKVGEKVKKKISFD